MRSPSGWRLVMFRLENHFDCELNTAIVSRSRRDLAYSTCSRDIRCWLREDGVIDDVVGLRAELRIDPLEETEGFDCRKVNLSSAWSTKCVASYVALQGWSRIHESCRVKPAIGRRIALEGAAKGASRRQVHTSGSVGSECRTRARWREGIPPAELDGRLY